MEVMDFIIEQYKAVMPENRKESIKILPICTLRLYDVVLLNSQLEFVACLLIFFPLKRQMFGSRSHPKWWMRQRLTFW